MLNYILMHFQPLSIDIRPRVSLYHSKTKKLKAIAENEKVWVLTRLHEPLPAIAAKQELEFLSEPTLHKIFLKMWQPAEYVRVNNWHLKCLKHLILALRGSSTFTLLFPIFDDGLQSKRYTWYLHIFFTKVFFFQIPAVDLS